MCGRYEFNDEKDIEEINKIIQEVSQRHNGGSFKAGEIRPTNNVPILALSGGKPALQIMQWGFPKWGGKGSIINARCETAVEKNMFKKSLIERRCVVPSTGFYEWQKRDNTKAKDKYLFTSENSPMLYMAGFYNIYKDGDNHKNCFVILTRDANRYMEDIHDRMPVILYKQELKDWLSDDKFIDYAFRREGIVLNREAI